MFEARISFRQWQEFSDCQRASIKTIAETCAEDVRCDFEFEYYGIEFTDAGWLQAAITDPDMINDLQVIYHG